MKKLLSIIALAIGLVASEHTFTIDDLWAVEYLDTEFDNEHRLFEKPTPDYSSVKGQDMLYRLASDVYYGGMVYKVRFHDVNDAGAIIQWYKLIPFINVDDKDKSYEYQCNNGCDPYVEYKKTMKEKYFNDEYVSKYLEVVNSADMLKRLEPLRKAFTIGFDMTKRIVFDDKQDKMNATIDNSSLSSKRKTFYKEKVKKLFATELEYLEYGDAQFMRYIFHITSSCGSKSSDEISSCIKEKISEIIKEGEKLNFDEDDYAFVVSTFYGNRYYSFFAQDLHSLEEQIKKDEESKK